jgi:hypothetical protein
MTIHLLASALIRQAPRSGSRDIRPHQHPVETLREKCQPANRRLEMSGRTKRGGRHDTPKSKASIG